MSNRNLLDTNSVKIYCIIRSPFIERLCKRTLRLCTENSVQLMKQG